MTKKQKNLLWRILIAAGLLGVLYFIPTTGMIRFFLYLIPYFVIGYDLLKRPPSVSPTARCWMKTFSWPSPP